MTPTIFFELTSADAAVACARLLRERGFEKIEAYTPYGIPELEKLITTRTRIPWASLAAGLFGALFSYSVIWFCNAYDYPLDVGGRPLNSIPADIPIMFETAVLFSALATLFALLLRSGLPRLAHPLFEIEGFERVSVDRYWIGVDAKAETDLPYDDFEKLGARVVHPARRKS